MQIRESKDEVAVAGRSRSSSGYGGERVAAVASTPRATKREIRCNWIEKIEGKEGAVVNWIESEGCSEEKSEGCRVTISLLFFNSFLGLVCKIWRTCLTCFQLYSYNNKSGFCVL